MMYPSLFNRLSMRMNQGWIRGGMTGLRVASQRKRDIAERTPFFFARTRLLPQAKKKRHPGMSFLRSVTA